MGVHGRVPVPTASAGVSGGNTYFGQSGSDLAASVRELCWQTTGRFTVRLFFAAMLCFAAIQLGAAVPGGAVFLEPAMAASAIQPGHSKVVIYFCGECPTARAFMNKEVKALQAAVQTSHAPLDIICLTPDLSGPGLAAYMEAVGLDRVLVGTDSVNEKKISLRNILQVDYEPGPGGKRLNITYSTLVELTSIVLDPKLRQVLGHYRYDPTGISDEAVLGLWWALENDTPGAIAALANARKKAKPDDARGQQIITLYDLVTPNLLGEIERLSAAGEDFPTFEALESALRRADGLDTKAGQTRLKELSRLPALKDEFKARDAWSRCQAMLASDKPKDQDMGKAGLGQLAAKMPDTVYGKKAASK